MNASLMKSGTDVDINSSNYTRTGSVIGGLMDAAYVYNVKLGAAVNANVTVGDSNRTLFTIDKGNTTPTDNGASMMCLNSAGCTVRNLIYGGDYLWKMTAKILGKTGINTSVLSVFQPAGTGTHGSGLIRWGAGERLAFYATPYLAGSNVSVYYSS